MVSFVPLHERFRVLQFNPVCHLAVHYFETISPSIWVNCTDYATLVLCLLVWASNLEAPIHNPSGHGSDPMTCLF